MIYLSAAPAYSRSRYEDDGGVLYQLSTTTRNDNSIQKNIINLPRSPTTVPLGCAEPVPFDYRLEHTYITYSP